MRIAMLHEHPTWSTDLIAHARRRGLNITPIDVGSFDFSVPNIDTSPEGPLDVWVNRVNAMPSPGRPATIVASTAHLLLALDASGARVVNGSRSHRIGGSKAAQAALFGRLDMATPASIGIFDASQAVAAADRLGYPVLIKPNVGGSGSGISRHDSPSALQAAISAGTVDLGIDGTGLVQQVIESTDGLIHRVEMLGSSFFYGTEQPLVADTFNYCAIDGCAAGEATAGSDEADTSIALFTPSAAIIEQAGRAMRASSTDVGGVEYIIDVNTGEPSFFDFNPYSNFVTGQNDELGFDPIDRYLDHIVALASQSS